ncbi:MAG: hypothetical protein AAFR46_02750 [Pseudomonadota bacterium]
MSEQRFGDLVLEALEKRQMTMRDLARVSGVSYDVIRELKRRKGSTSHENAQAIKRALGLDFSDDKLSEVDTLRFAAGFAEPELAPWQPPSLEVDEPPSDDFAHPFVRALSPSAMHPIPMKTNRNFFGFSIRSGDVIIYDANGAAKDGDLVVGNVVDMKADTARTVVRRLFTPFLVPSGMSDSEPRLVVDDDRVSIMGPIVAVWRGG